MTDSMKFGPEWLRNMSADNTSSNLLSSVGTSLSNSGNVMTTSSSNNGGNGSGHHSFGITSNVSSTAITPYSFALAPRNIFPEFRYGREEMLSLFDKNYNMPEILPTFKKIFIEKVQLPLALTPSTDEELLPQVPPVSTQRQSWILRSPVGFNSSTRGSGRGGSVDRGRMRGKSNYHQIYQRPTAMFGDDDPRSVQLKPDRGWSERNGAGDSLNIGGANVCGIGGSNSDWNGTPTSSPRKDISGHPRNMENWRRNRNEDGSGDASTCSLSNSEGWRGGSGTGGSFVATHRWGRSTSWREEDMSSANANDIGYVNSSGSSGLTMQRSHSNIMTVNERGGYVPSNSGSSAAKPPLNSYGPTGNQNSNRTFSSLSGLSTPSSRNPHWNNSSSTGCSSVVDGEDNLPEWAMENPLDSGGTFDASGAFHGSVEEGDNEKTNKQCRKKSDSSSGSSARNNEGNNGKESKSSETSTGKTGSSFKNENINSNVNEMEVSMKLPREILSESRIENSAVTDKLVSENTAIEDADGLSQIQEERKPDICNRIVISEADTIANTSYYKSHIDDSISKSHTATTANNNDSGHPDLSDRMREVTDDMIEKLIMDDDTISINDNSAQNEIQQDTTPPLVQVTVATSTPAVNNLCAPSAFTTVAAMHNHPPHQTIPRPVSVTSSLTTLTEDGLHKGIQLYGGGLVIDHATMQHHHMQQQQIAVAAASAANITPGGRASHSINSTTSTAAPVDLWYYRDPQSKVQGPFTATEMAEWYRAGYFNENLFVRRFCDTHFRSLGDLIKVCNDNMPFTHSHLIPNLNNMPLPNAASGSVRKSQKPQQSAQQGEQRDQLKGNMNNANYLGEAVKNVMPVDVSNVYFQMLRHQEILMYNELLENECFQQLTPSEKEAVVRQKLQMHSEYIPNLSGLSNSLAAINHSAARARMYDVIMEGPKKDHLFSGSVNPGGLNTHQQPQSNPFLDHEGFLINSQQRQQPIQTIFSAGPFGNALPTGGDSSVPVNDDTNGNELLNNFNMGMYLPSTNGNPPLIPNPKTQDFLAGGNADFLNGSHILVARNSLTPNPLVHAWTSINSQQPSNEWTNNLLMGIPMAVTQGSSNNVENVNNMAQDIQQHTPQHPQKNIPTPMWNLPSLDHTQNEEAKQLDTESSKSDFENQKFLKVQSPPKEGQLSEKETQSGLFKSVDAATEKQLDISIQTRQQNSPTVVKPTTAILTKHRKDEIIDKFHNGSTKRLGKQQMTGNKSSKGSEESSSGKKILEERRRDQVEDKRRQKEEKKRHQADEEKRRQQHMDEEKRRQMLEEKERQQQIQAQRRKAMLGNNLSTDPIAASSPSSKSKEHQRVQSSIAPWSTQTNPAASEGGPCLAEIQKAERRERQMEQRQMEMFVKRVRASAAAAVEAFDTMLKWNAPVKEVPVKNFAEIQAEEAKRLANEQMEMQRRRDHEQQQATATMGPGNNAGLGANNISAIWTGTKVWAAATTTGFWEEPIKFSATVATNNSASTNTVGVGFSLNNNNISKQTTTGPQKSSDITGSGGQNVNQQNAVTRNIRKSQTVPVMQNAGSQNGRNTKNNNQQQPTCTAKQGFGNKAQPQKVGGNHGDGGSISEKRGTSKIQFNAVQCGTTMSSNIKRDEYENEFITWCTKILNNMNTKLDVPTFVTFLRDLESPYEVKDYIRMYLGENKESTDFGKQFLERRSRYKNLQRAQNAHNDDMCKPAPAITPSGNDSTDNKGKHKKLKKNKMTKLDARILGFSVTAAEGRTNVGDRVYVDTP